VAGRSGHPVSGADLLRGTVRCQAFRSPTLATSLPYFISNGRIVDDDHRVRLVLLRADLEPTTDTTLFLGGAGIANKEDTWRGT